MAERASRWDTFPLPSPPAPPAPTSMTEHATAAAPAPDLPGLRFSPTAWIPDLERVTIMAAIRRLPQESIVGQFARGDCQRGLVAGGISTVARVYKSWHQDPNQHITVELFSVDEHGTQVERGIYGTAHVYENGLESIREHKTAHLLVRQPGRTVWDTHRPFYPGVTEGERTPPWRRASAPTLPPIRFVCKPGQGMTAVTLVDGRWVDQEEELRNQLCFEPWISK